jgi:hypothetical protein
MTERIQLVSKKPETKRDNPASNLWKTNYSLSLSSPSDCILYLQRTIGNQAVQRLIKSGALQAKLRIGQPGDKYEQEADRVADAVMRMPEPQEASSGAPSIQRACPTCEEDELRRQPIKEEEEELQRQPIEDEEEELQAKATSGRISEANPNIESRIQSLKGGGRPLSENDRAFFEPRFGHDFSQVRMHSDAKAAEAARAVNARAFTVGNDMVFGERQYAPGTTAGQRLLAHELTHVVQQSEDAGKFRKDGVHINPNNQPALKGLGILHESSICYLTDPKAIQRTISCSRHRISDLAEYWDQNVMNNIHVAFRALEMQLYPNARLFALLAIDKINVSMSCDTISNEQIRLMVDARSYLLEFIGEISILIPAPNLITSINVTEHESRLFQLLNGAEWTADYVLGLLEPRFRNPEIEYPEP